MTRNKSMPPALQSPVNFAEVLVFSSPFLLSFRYASSAWAGCSTRSVKKRSSGKHKPSFQRSRT